MAETPERAPLADVREEALRLLGAAEERGLTIRAIGGLAVAIRCPSAARPPLAREYKDLDVVGFRSERKEIDEFLVEQGYEADKEFNVLQGHERLLHNDRVNGRQLDTFLDRFSLCHTLDLRSRLALDKLTLTPADLMLSKLQVVETNERDFKDMVALLVDADIDDERIARVCAEDWGWWRTVTGSLDNVEAYAEHDGIDTDAVRERLAALLERIEAEPKSLRWRARAKVGDRVRWYELPEEDA
jgi:hypothetical protein